ncbi:MAG: phospholipid carrier-dependent glycosyltransferase, partial [Candidatus Beckwithbacteria bacterium]
MKKLDKIFLGLIVFLAIFLRFVNLGSNPPSLYWEEAALGYDAYSILKTGKDFHGNPWPLVAFESFGDYKPSLYFYTTVPFIALFDLTPLAVRFPSALFGSLTVLLVFLFAKQFFKKPTVPLLSALFLCLSP